MHFGFKVILTTDPSKTNDKPNIKAEVDAWIVDIVDEYAEHFWLDDLFDGDVPVLFGIGNDGAEAAVKISQHASIIWAQDSKSSANSSMPDSAVFTGHVSYIGSPRQLASQLVNYLQTQWTKLP
jgi:hypothetical protein